MFEKHLWKSVILSKDAGQRPASLFKMSLFHRYFSNILLVKCNYLVYPISGTLVENGLIEYQKFFCTDLLQKSSYLDYYSIDSWICLTFNFFRFHQMDKY